MNEELEKQYTKYVTSPSDINELLPILRKYAEECDVIVEAGVRWIVSTWAFLAAKPKKVISVDWLAPSNWGADLDKVIRVAQENGIYFEFRQQTTIPTTERPELTILNIESDDVDFMFIDTFHVYQNLKVELALHSKFVKKYIGMHDTTLYAVTGEDQHSVGLWPAVEEFLQENPNWVLKERFTHNNGLTILERIS